MLLDQPAPVEQSPLHCADVPQPAPRAREIRVRVLCCGICHTDLHIAEGELSLPKLPLVPGHQIVGTVDALGEGVSQWTIGDRVGIPWLHWTDGECEYCRAGLENLCENAEFTGYQANGGYAEYVVVAEDFAYGIPKVFSSQNAAPLLCAGVIGYRSYRLSRIHPGGRLGLYGFGGSAHLVLQLAHYEKCEVYVFTRAHAHRELAAKLGAAWVGGAEERPPRLLDSAIIFAPAGGLVPLALQRLRKGGTLALAGITMSTIPALDYSLLYQERVVRSVANSTRADCREFLELAARVPLQTEVQMFDLEQANEGLQALKHSEIKGAAVLQIAS